MKEIIFEIISISSLIVGGITAIAWNDWATGTWFLVLSLIIRGR